METKPNNNPENKNEELTSLQKFFQSHTARLIIVGIITMVMAIPLAQINWLIGERQDRQNSVTEELKTEWGDDLEYYGIVLEIPLLDSNKGKNGALYVYPEKSADNIETSVNERYRGIFKANLFSANINSQNIFDLSGIITDSRYRNADWNKVRVVMVTSSNVRFKAFSPFIINGKTIEISGQESSEYLLSYSNKFSLDPKSHSRISIGSNATINGSGSIKQYPFASKSTMQVSSNWKSPSFKGNSLPDSNSFKLTKNGFTAKWSNLQSLGNGSKTSENKITTANPSMSEIAFITTVDQYQLNERTIKYSILVLVLTFAVFFLIQIIGKVTVHPLHYLMIGLALSLFYSLLLAFSEHLGFNGAYILAASAIILLIVWYARSILNSLKFALVSGISLSLLYAFLLVIVNLEIYAMLVGSVGLLVVLAAIMSITRKMNFYKL